MQSRRNVIFLINETFADFFHSCFSRLSCFDAASFRKTGILYQIISKSLTVSLAQTVITNDVLRAGINLLQSQLQLSAFE